MNCARGWHGARRLSGGHCLYPGAIDRLLDLTFWYPEPRLRRSPLLVLVSLLISVSNGLSSASLPAKNAQLSSCETLHFRGSMSSSSALPTSWMENPTERR